MAPSLGRLRSLPLWRGWGLRPTRGLPAPWALHLHPLHTGPALGSPLRKAGPHTNLTVAKVQEVVDRFRKDLDSPDHTLITSKVAMRRFQLTERDLSRLPATVVMSLENPYDASSSRLFKHYWLPDVVRLAKEVHGAEYLIHKYTTYVVSGEWEEENYRKVYGWSKLRKEMQQQPQANGKGPRAEQFNFVNSLSNVVSLRGSIGKQPPGMKAVLQSLWTNIAICGGKVVIWLWTGSAAILADAMHSLADVLNALLRFYGIQSSEGSADAHHPYGHERRRFVVADRSASVVLVFGCLLPLFHGWGELFVARELLHANAIIGIFCFSLFMESLQVRKAYGELKTQATEKQMTVVQYYRHGPEMMSISTFTEACIGMLGSTIGIVGVWASSLTGNVFFDGLSGIGIATVVGAAALFLLHKNEEQLVGCTLPIEVVVHLTQLLLADDVVTSVHDIKTEVYGTRVVRYKAEIHFNAEAITRRYMGLGTVPSTEVERCVEEIRALMGSSPVDTQVQVEDWLMRNNARFLSHLSLELKRVEQIIRTHLQTLGYNKIHVDLEPW